MQKKSSSTGQPLRRSAWLTPALGGALVLMAAVWYACVKPPDYPKEPVIAFKSVSKNSLRQIARDPNESLMVTLTFTDGDGDLGFQDTTASLFITDGRSGFKKLPYSIPYVEQQGTGNGISGEITIRIPAECCTDTLNGIRVACREVRKSFDTFFYRIAIKDRAGNLSNEIRTPSIQLRCQ
jgi:hypothetical protein